MAKSTVGAGAVLLAAALTLMGCADTISGDGQALLPSSATQTTQTSAPGPTIPPAASTAPTSPPTGPSTAPPTTRRPPTTTPPPTLASPIPPAPKGVAIIESHRLGAAIIDPAAVDPSATAGCVPAGPVPTPAATNIAFPNGAEVMGKTGYVGGWFACFHAGPADASTPSVVVAAMEFTSTEGAEAAGALVLGDDGTPLTLDGAPGARALIRGVDKNVVVEGFDVHGRLASYVYASSPTASGGAAKARALAATTLTAQTAALTSFTPTPPDKWGSLNDDPGELAGKIVQPEGNPSWYAGGYDLASYRAIAQSASQEIPKLKATGFVEYYLRDGTTDDGYAGVGLYQLKSDPAAKAAWKVLTALLASENPKATVIKPKIADIPATKKGQKGKPVTSLCVEFPLDSDTVEQHCMIVAHKYVVEVDVYGYPQKSGDMAFLQKIIAQQLALTPAS